MDIKQVKENARKERVKLKGAVWQYLVDHSFPYKTGGFAIRFNIKNKNEFFRRVRAREQGKFKREDIDKKWLEVQNYIHYTEKVLEKSKKMEALKNKNIFYKSLFWIKKKLQLFLEKRAGVDNP